MDTVSQSEQVKWTLSIGDLNKVDQPGIKFLNQLNVRSMSYFCIVIIDILHSSFYLVTMLNAQPIIHGCYAASYYSIKEVLNKKKIH